MSARVTSSSRRSPVRATTSSIDANRFWPAILHRGKPLLAGDRVPHGGPQAIHVPQPEANGAIVFDRTIPARGLYVNRMEEHAAPLRVFDERRRMIKAHWLVVEERGVEGRGIVRLQVRAGVGNQGEACGGGFGG